MDESPTLAGPTLGWLLLSDDTHMRKEIQSLVAVAAAAVAAF